MRKILVQEFITLDGVMQAPGGPEEDTVGGFSLGGWTAPYFSSVDAEASDFMQKWMVSTDILLGRKTFTIFDGYWPEHTDLWPGINDVTKYVVSTTLDESAVSSNNWPNCVLLKTVDDLKQLKETDGGDIKVHGSGQLAQTLFEHNLVDELCLMTFPIVVGKGKRLFSDNAAPLAFTMTESLVTSNGVIIANYQRDGNVKTGSVA